MQPSFLTLADGRRIAYYKTPGKLPCVIFMGGFRSNMNGAKATALEDFCKERGQAFVRFDYTGHGESSGKFEQGTIGAWKQDALDVFDALGEAENILVGSSMGAWIMLLVALARKAKIKALVGVASAVDFTEAAIASDLTDVQKHALENHGMFYAPACGNEEPYPITRALLEDGRKHLLLGGAIALEMPVRLIHGMQDEDVPWQASMMLVEALASQDVRLTLVKSGGHRLSDPEELRLLMDTVKTFC